MSDELIYSEISIAAQNLSKAAISFVEFLKINPDPLQWPDMEPNSACRLDEV